MGRCNLRVAFHHREEGVACHWSFTVTFVRRYTFRTTNWVSTTKSKTHQAKEAEVVSPYPFFWNTYEPRESWRSGLLNGRQIVINCLRRPHVVTWKLRLPWSFCLDRMCLSDPCVFVNKQTVPFYRLLHKLFQQVWCLILPKDVSQSTSSGTTNSCTMHTSREGPLG